ncbi:MAG: DUF6062 family protein [Clostridiales bacterium]|nr:DUF6062 family protein [Clostridiales bacterium]
MKEEIYTIPVMDAFNQDGCPFCAMRRKLEKDSIDFMLGPSYMEDDIRMETDRKGFCRRHLVMMYEQQNRLGLALMVGTRLKRVIKNMSVLPKETSAKRKGFFKKAEEAGSSAYGTVLGSCYICDRIGGTFDRYVSTFFYMWPKEKELRAAFEKSPICVPHFAMLRESGKKYLNGTHEGEFQAKLSETEDKILAKLDADLDLFIRKFDYRYKDEPEGDSRDALPRAINALSGEDGA